MKSKDMEKIYMSVLTIFAFCMLLYNYLVKGCVIVC